MKHYRPQLDGLRAIAVLGVVLQHYAPPSWSRIFSPGGLGVGLFFVLSGYLITGILMRGRTDSSHEGTDGFQFLKHFYIRRALRIMPVYYAALLFGLWAGISPIRETFGWHAAYLSNIYFALKSSYCGAISPLWSLAVEQHFYLIWPCILWWVPQRHLKTAIWTMIATGFAFRVLILTLGWNAVARSVLTPCAFEPLGCGALLALATYRQLSPSTQQLKSLLLLGLCLYPLALYANLKRPDTASTFAINGLASCLLFYWLVAGAAQGFKSRWGIWLGSALWVRLGKLSYGIYLFHELIYSLISPEWNTHWVGLRALIAFICTCAIATVSYELLETPIHNLKRYFPYRRAMPEKEAPVLAIASLN
jgi:peptidoglycan/LPS O-acetylase OafA/YrhL